MVPRIVQGCLSGVKGAFGVAVRPLTPEPLRPSRAYTRAGRGLPSWRAEPPPAGSAAMITGLVHSRAFSTRECAKSLIMAKFAAHGSPRNRPLRPDRRGCLGLELLLPAAASWWRCAPMSGRLRAHPRSLLGSSLTWRGDHGTLESGASGDAAQRAGVRVGRRGLPGGRAAPPETGPTPMVTGSARSRAFSTRECSNVVIKGLECAPGHSDG
ncbi:hypothetical protein GCM10009559_04720 [Pseudonocardia zijingensis]|uniref:Uncharacterized protein n=1 Tax=Pseudonocardia zijingensis TaxID=153376 RepID=A0ABN1P2L8_9PSEU